METTIHNNNNNNNNSTADINSSKYTYIFEKYKKKIILIFFNISLKNV